MRTESEVIRAVREGDHGAFAELVETYQRPVFNLAYRMLGDPSGAEDAAQEAFLRVYRSIAAYDPARPFSTWILSITAHHCIDTLRKKRMKEVSLDGLPPWRQLASESIDPLQNFERAQQAASIKRLLEALPTEYRLVVVLRYWHDLGYAEIAEITGESQSAIKSRLHRARHRMAEMMSTDSRPTAPRLATDVESSGAASSATYGGMSACNATLVAG